jgi:hypothetical protein
MRRDELDTRACCEYILAGCVALSSTKATAQLSRQQFVRQITSSPYATRRDERSH